MRPLHFLLLTLAFLLFAALCFPFAWSHRVRTVHLRVRNACRRAYYGDIV